MKAHTKDCLFLAFLVLMVAVAKGQKDVAINFLKKYNAEAPMKSYINSIASWNYATNLTNYNKDLSVKADLAYSTYAKQVRENASRIKLDGLDSDTKRQFSLILSTASSKDAGTRKEYADIVAQMDALYSKGCVNANPSDVPTLKLKAPKCLRLDSDLIPLLRKSKNFKELSFAWKGWRDATGPKIRPLYQKFVTLSNKGAKENNWADYGAYLRSWYEYSDLQALAEKLYNDLKPFYEELHAYVRYKLAQKYPEVKDGEPIPANILGNMWSQEWGSVYDLVVPFKGEPNLDVTAKLKQKYKTAKDLFKVAESFFASIGWQKLPPEFWKNTQFIDPKPIDGRDVTCHASAWDFMINDDVRVKMCTQINQDDFITIHHELGHIYYYLLYWNQSYEYRTGANPGFHEAVGDTLALSVQTPGHLYKIGLMDSLPNNTRSELNFLLKSALEKIAFVPFGYLIDQWRWDVYSGKTTPQNYNQKWWELRTKYQGIRPPVSRSESDFDPGAKYHVPGNTPYIRYFFSTVLQFQFHKAACDASGYKGDLHQCSIYKSKEAGRKLGDMLSLGKSKPWPQAYKSLTGTDVLSSSAIRHYFDPLYKWMKEQRESKGYKLGWEPPSAAARSTSSGLFLVTCLLTLGAYWL